MEKVKFLTPQEVAQILRISDRTVYRLIKSGDVPSVRIGKQWRIPASYVWADGIVEED